jgi:hypothetical protein
MAAMLALIGQLTPPPIHASQAAPPQSKPAAAPATTPPSKPAGPATSPQSKPAAGATPPAVVDGGWPRVYDVPSGGTLLLYQPQIASWENQKHMVAYSAVSQRTPNVEKPAVGTIKIEADTQVAVAERLVHLTNLKIVEANFPTLSKDQSRSTASSRTSTRAALCREMSKASKPIRRPSSSARRLRSWSTSTASPSGARSRTTI